jgi:membrane-associated HD superfamily phosphohydrolase
MSETKGIWQPSLISRNKLIFLAGILATFALWPDVPGGNILRMLGFLIVSASCWLVLYVYLIVFFPEIVRVTLKTMFIVLLIVSFIALTRIGLSFPDRNIIPLIPYAIIPVIIRTFYDTRLAIFVMMIASALLSFFVPGSSETGFMMFVSGFAAIFSLVNYHRRPTCSGSWARSTSRRAVSSSRGRRPRPPATGSRSRT